MGNSYTQDEWATFAKIDAICLREDIRYIAEEMEIELTDEEVEDVAVEYADTESMEVAKRTTIENAILRLKGE